MDPSGSKLKGGLIPITSLKQKGQDGKACFFCGGKGDLRCPSEEGKNRIIEAAKERQRLNDQATSSIIKKILPGNGQEIAQFKYHYQCNINFTHKGKIERLSRKHEESQRRGNSTEEGRSSRRSSRESMLSIGIYVCFAKIQVLVICTMFIQWNFLERL